MSWTRSPSARLLFWCIAGAAIAQAIIMRASAGNPDRFSRIFWQLLTAFDTHGNLLLAALAVLAFLLRGNPAALAFVRFAADRPWRIAAALFPLLCLGSLRIYHDYPLSMDEYAAVFQARAFAAGRLAGEFPPDLIDRLIPGFFQNYFFGIRRATGEVSSSYWPGFSLLLAPFAWLHIPWAANPAIGAATIPAIHLLARQVTGSREAAGWAVLITCASPAFIVSSISYYSMSAHLLCNLLYALLLLRPSVPRALLAGSIGSLALTLHNPVPHLLFCLPFIAWLCFRRGSVAILGALVAGYLPISLLVGAGWHEYLADLARGTAVTAGTAALPSAPAGGAEPSLLEAALQRVAPLLQLPQAGAIQARIAGLSKLWTWGAPGFLVLAAYGCRATRAAIETRILAAALALTFFGYFFVPFDQGHGWGYRYMHSVWFVVPVFAAMALDRAQGAPGDALRNLCAWGMALSLVFANGLRLTQVEAFIHKHMAQVPPLMSAASADRPEVVFVNLSAGLYTQDMVQNDPFLRGPRQVMVYSGAANTATFMAQRFPGYLLTSSGPWGELWRSRAPAPAGR